MRDDIGIDRNTGKGRLAGNKVDFRVESPGAAENVSRRPAD